MTVINMLSLGESGLAVADEQVSNELRKSNIYQKLRPLGKTSIFGGTGSANFLMEIYQLVYDKLKESNKSPLREIYEFTNNILIEQKNLFKRRILQANLGIDSEDFVTGSLVSIGKPLSDNVKMKAEQLFHQIDEMTNARILIGGMESDNFAIYSVDSFGTGIRSSFPYDSIGSGADESQKALSNYISRLKKDNREQINRVEGLLKVIEATNSSARTNVGVGGTFSIAYITKEGIKMPDEDKCKLASEIVDGLTYDFINKNEAYEMLDKLIFRNYSFEDIEKEFKDNAKNWGNLDRMLRGYKI